MENSPNYSLTPLNSQSIEIYYSNIGKIAQFLEIKMLNRKYNLNIFCKIDLMRNIFQVIRHVGKLPAKNNYSIIEPLTTYSIMLTSLVLNIKKFITSEQAS